MGNMILETIGRARGLLEDVGAYGRLLQQISGVAAPADPALDYSDPIWRDRMRTSVERIHPKRMTLRLIGYKDETSDTRTFRFERTDAPLPPFRAGQYVNLFVTVSGVRTSRPYSISSPPGKPWLELTVRRKAGGFVTSHLFEGLELGDSVESSGPVGHFYHEALIDGDNLVFLAGGSGITPFMAMLRDFDASGAFESGLRVSLLYGVRGPDSAAFLDELQELEDRQERFNFTLVVSEPVKGYRGTTGLLDRLRLRRSIRGLGNKRYYLCGPTPMLELCAEALAQLRVPQHRIRQELFGPPDDITRSPAWPTDIGADARFSVRVGERAPFAAKASESLLNAMERQGIVTPAICRAGSCSACRLKLVSGEVVMPPSTGLRESDLAQGYIHTCVAYPISDLKLAP